MNATRTMIVELPESLVRLVEEKVVSGEYGSASEVVRDGLEALDMDGSSDERLRAEVLPVFDACLRDPSRVKPLDEVFDRLERKYLAGRDPLERDP